MPEETLIGAIIGGVILLIMVIWFFSTYNRLIRLRENVNQAWSNIDVLLTQRYEMLPNLVKIVKSYATHEKELFEKFAAARQMAAGALQQGDVKGVSQAESMLTGVMPKIFALSESYPELKANENFMKLQEETVSIENQVSDRREFFNASATNWNAAIAMIPTNIVASFMSAARRDLFEVESAAMRSAVQLDL
jgi:LemA protein